MIVAGVPRETADGERRVALVPAVLPSLTKGGIEVLVETGAGVSAGFSNSAYEEKGARIAPSRAVLFAQADCVLQVRGAGAEGGPEAAGLRDGQISIGFYDPLSFPERIADVAATRAACLSMELMPRITRAQSMDVLSSMATIAGYKAVLLAASHLPRMFPMLMTAAGTVAPAHVFVVGVGCRRTCRPSPRLAASAPWSSAYDVRPAVQGAGREPRREVRGTRARDRRGRRQGRLRQSTGRRLLPPPARADGRAWWRESDVVITTAAVPGKQGARCWSPPRWSRGMKPGSVIVDLAAERGGNCELTRAGETVVARRRDDPRPGQPAVERSPITPARCTPRTSRPSSCTWSKTAQLNLDAGRRDHPRDAGRRDGAVVHPRVTQLLGEGKPNEASPKKEKEA